jgi:hypothetical protein
VDVDVDGDGVPDNVTDADGDGINDANDTRDDTSDDDGDGIPNGYDLDVDVPAWGSGQRKCRQCPPGTYINKNRRNPTFQQITCKPCPRGMVSARIIDDKNLFIPEDVKDLTKEHLPNVIFPAVSYELFGCRACSTSDGVGQPNNNVCFQCQRNAVTRQFEQYQHAEHVAIGAEFSLIMGTGSRCREYQCTDAVRDHTRAERTDAVTPRLLGF